MNALKNKRTFPELLRSREFAWFLLIPLLIYIYYLKWKLTSIHDDDLYLYKGYADAKSTFQRMNVSLSFGQYRPVRDMVMYTIMKLFDKDFAAYYAFNVLVQSINTILFACTLNLLLRSMGLSLFLSLIYGLSRFCFYNVTQMLDGGPLEGLAMVFFLSFLFSVVWVSTRPDLTVSRRYKGILWGILFANLAMYTHERYLAIFPFILLMILFFPRFREFSIKQKFVLSLLTLASVILNIVVKVYYFSVPFLVGTGNTHIDFSFSKAFKFLLEAVFSLFQYSIGPEWLVGLKFSSLPVFYGGLVILIICLMLGVAAVFLWKAILGLMSEQNAYPPNTALVIFLPVLLFLTLAPCIFQGRTELRWLQAPLCILILMFVIALKGLDPKKNAIYLVSFVLGISFLCTNYYYLDKGGKNVYYSTSARIGNAFDSAIKDSIVHLGKPNLYIWERKRNLQREAEIKWATVDGFFFEPYHSSSKNLIFTDTLSTFSGFDNKRDEIIYMDIRPEDQTFRYLITNITKEFFRDSLRKFEEETFGIPDPTRVIQYDQNELTIANDNFIDFITDGFYENENGVRWTNGKASIKLIGSFVARDSLRMELSTYMPPVCKNVTIRPVIDDINGKEHKAALSKRENDKFNFSVYFERPVRIKGIRLFADTIPTVASDPRRLSFLFGNLKLINGSGPPSKK